VNIKEIIDTFKGVKSGNSVPVAPIYHTAASLASGITLREYATDAAKMTEMTLWACREFGFNGVQMTLGVATEAEALGAKTVQAEKGLPAVTTHLLQDPMMLGKLKIPDPYRDGRMPLFVESVRQVQKTIGDRAAVIATVRGPFVIAGQLRGLTPLMTDIYDDPVFVKELLWYSAEVSFIFAKALVTAAKIPVIAVGEALCSPDFISPDFYRESVAPLHRRLAGKLHDLGLKAALIHVCGNVSPIIDTLFESGFDTIDIDSKADLGAVLEALKRAKKPAGLRGNLDPSWLLKANASEVSEKCKGLLKDVKDVPWILSSGCDVPYGTPGANMKAMVEAAAALKDEKK
jgi:uroporphyrinogen decarboxylase